jgi:hypothetical protein
MTTTDFPKCRDCGEPLTDGRLYCCSKCVHGDSKDGLAAEKRLPPNAGKGRPAGSLNKTTRAAKEAIAFAAEGLGGAERLIAWAQSDEKNESAFWTTIYPKLLPLQVSGEGGGPIVISASPLDERI